MASRFWHSRGVGQYGAFEPRLHAAYLPILAKQVHLNTVLTAVAWGWTEPQEDKYDFHLVDAAIDLANQNDLRLVWLWFGSWKNGESNFAPGWVKGDYDRFPRAQIQNGKNVEILSTLSDSNLQADARAFAALMRHVREVDKNHRVIMAQVENEVGLLGDSRDRSPAANEAFAKPVPKEFMDYLQKHKDTLLPEFRKIGRPPASRPREPGRKCSGKASRRTRSSWAGTMPGTSARWPEAGKREYPSRCLRTPGSMRRR